MLLVAAVVALARGAEVSKTELAPTVQAAREAVGAPIAIVTQNRSQERAVQSIVGSGDYTFANAGSPSETRVTELGVTCAMFMTRLGMGANSPWTVTPVGDCETPEVVDAAIPTVTVGTGRVFEHERQFRHGMNVATFGVVGLPSVGLVFLLVGYPVGVIESPDAGTVLLLVAAGAAIAAPPTVAIGALSSAHALRTSGVFVSTTAGHTSLVLLGAAAVAPLLHLNGVAGVCLVGSFVSGGVQMAMDTAAYRASDLDQGRAARFAVMPIPFVAGDVRGLALTGAF